MRKTHYYLLDTSTITPGTAVSQLQFLLFDHQPFEAAGIKVTHSLIHPPTHPPTFSLTHSLTFSLTPSLCLCLLPSHE